MGASRFSWGPVTFQIYWASGSRSLMLRADCFESKITLPCFESQSQITFPCFEGRLQIILPCFEDLSQITQFFRVSHELHFLFRGKSKITLPCVEGQSQITFPSGSVTNYTSCFERRSQITFSVSVTNYTSKFSVSVTNYIFRFLGSITYYTSLF